MENHIWKIKPTYSCTVVPPPGRSVHLSARSWVRLSHSEDREGWSHLPAHTSREWNKTPEVIERWGMQVSTAGEVCINLRQMCITGSYIVIIHTPQTSDLQSYTESLRWQSGTGLHNPVSTIPCANKQRVRNGRGDWVMIWEALGFLGRPHTCGNDCLHACTLLNSVTLRCTAYTVASTISAIITFSLWRELKSEKPWCLWACGRSWGWVLRLLIHKGSICGHTGTF